MISKQMNIIDAYLKTNNFQKACQMSGLSPLLAHLALAKAGLLKIQDKIDYGTDSQRLGGEAEKRFQELFPEAIDANAMWKRNNPVFDFNLWGLTIDVKFSSFRKDKRYNKRTYWGFNGQSKRAGKPDFYFVFLENDDELNGMENPYLIIVPSIMVHQKSSVNITRSSHYFTDFQVEPNEARKILRGYAEMIGDIETAEKAASEKRVSRKTTELEYRTEEFDTYGII